jgi:hypothetical protein
LQDTATDSVNIDGGLLIVSTHGAIKATKTRDIYGESLIAGACSIISATTTVIIYHQ